MGLLIEIYEFGILNENDYYLNEILGLKYVMSYLVKLMMRSLQVMVLVKMRLIFGIKKI